MAMAYATSIRVLVVDDHELVRRGLISVLDEMPDMRVIGEAATGEEAVQLARSLQPDVVFMDLRMPGFGGLEAARRIRIWVPQARVIAVTAWSDEPGHRLLKNGISACVGKNVTRPELEAVLQRVLRNSAPKISEPDPANPFAQLTGRETQVVHLMLAGQKATEIAAKLFITTKTVHTFRYRIYEKLGISGDVELAKLANSHGLIGINP